MSLGWISFTVRDHGCGVSSLSYAPGKVLALGIDKMLRLLAIRVLCAVLASIAGAMILTISR